jgi:integrase
MGLCKDGYWREYERYDGNQYIGCAGRYDKKTGKQRSDKEMQAAALKNLMEKLSAAKSGITTLNSNTTVKKWIDTWLETYVEPTDITKKTFSDIKGKVEKNIVSELGSLKLKDVKDTHLQRILNANHGKSFSQVDKLRQYMRRIFGQAVKSKLIPYNPAADLVLPKASDKKRRSITPAERAAFLKAAETHRAGLWVKTMLYCGLRPGECIPLQWKDIDFKNKLLRVYKAKERGSNEVKAPKTEAGFRDIPIPDILLVEFKAKKGKPLEYVFTQATSKKCHTESSLRWAWTSFIYHANIAAGAKTYKGGIVKAKLADDLVPYMLRHTYATDLEKAGVPINIAKYLLGHEDITTTANIYTHKDTSVIESAAASINAFHDKDLTKTSTKTPKSKTS